jgi:ribose transport system ATP-binding protein
MNATRQTVDERVVADGSAALASLAALEIIDVSKSFPGVKALDRVSMTLRRGEVHALLGENGAGKSTLIKIIAGVLTPDEGQMRLKGGVVRFENPRQAFVAGINVVHQERNLVPTFSVAENIMLEQITEQALGRVRREEIERQARQYMDIVGLDLPPSHAVDTLSAGQQQMIEIARALSSQAEILLLDEPTASISLKETETLFETIRRLQAEGVTFLFVSHKLEEIYEIADSVTVLRDGRNAGPSQPLADLRRDQLVTLMVGRSEQVTGYPTRSVSVAEPVLEIDEVRSRHSPYPNGCKLFKGEILGWYGLVGAGRTELARVVIGIDPATSGEIRVRGVPARITSVSQALHRWHIGYVSEKRQEEGLFLAHTIARNISSTVWDKLRSRLGLLDTQAETRLAEEYRQKLDIRTPGITQLVTNLSGGNRQKVSIARGLAAQPEILIVDEPTVGIDIKTNAEIHDLIWNLAQQGISIIVISSDMPEMIRLVDRVVVFRDGKICGELPNSKDYDTMSKRMMELILGESKDPS